MNIDGAQLVEQFGEHNVLAFFLVLARVSPLFLLAPLFSSKSVPARVKGIVAVALAIGLSPVVAKGLVIPGDVLSIATLIGKELLIGGGFAFVLGALFAAVAVAGSFLDTLVGFSFGSLVDPITGNQSSVLTQMYSFISITIFIVIGGDAWVIRGFAETYEIVGLLQMPSLPRLVGGSVLAFTGIFVAAIEISGPIILALILTDAAFGVVTRVVPSINVFGVGFPVKATIGLLLISITLPFTAGWIADEMQQSVAAALQVLRVG